jgi:CheY-like chemotaxis protein
VEGLTYEQFTACLRSALHYLYDPVHLRNSPLITLLDLKNEFDSASALQQTLLLAIRALKPPDDEPPQSRAWRVYDTLHFRHVQHLSREALATQLGISERQLRREQRVALEQMAQVLWASIGVSSQEEPADGATQPTAEAGAGLNEELEWLKQEATEPSISLINALDTVLDLAQPLAQQWRTPLEIVVPPALAEMPVSPLALRTILLTVLNVAIPRATPGPVQIRADRSDLAVEVTVTCKDGPPGQPPLTKKDLACLQTAQNLADFYGGQFACSHQAGMGFTATFTLHLLEQVPVLVVDDNADWIELQQRYVAGTRYQITGVRDPVNAQPVAQKLQPAVILLDVMMHNVDGWQILSELRHMPATTAIPVVICTILPVEELALSLGANAFLQKPVTRHLFLKTLDQQSKLVSRQA